jgi:hypothetical protein
MSDYTREEMRSIMREAITEWMDARFAKFSVWTIKGISAAIFAGVVWLVFQSEIITRFPNQH